MDSAWFKNAIIYGVNIPTFQDSNGDGIGDINGLTGRLDYLADLGVNCLWLLPFYPSPRRDNGYDVSNYYAIDLRLGSIDDFRELAYEANARGIRILIDLVVHHTSDAHPWFQAARSDRHSSYRDYYIWSDTRPEIGDEVPFFPDAESGVWRYDAISRSYFHHGFYHFQPDLNFANPGVQHEVQRIMDFWLSLGVSGFRIDAADKIVGRKGLPGTEVIEPNRYWSQIRAWLNERRPEAILLAEADMPIGDIDKYINKGRGIHMLLNFWSNQTIMYALASQDRRPLIDTINELPVLPGDTQYVCFLRNLDELNIARLTDEEKRIVFRRFGPKKTMQAYGRGIRRRLAPMLGGSTARIRLAFGLLFSMPGAAMLVYGDEIGMGENLALEERDSVRTPMQWSDAEQAGFSTAHSSFIIHRMVTDAKYAPDKINVAAQQKDPDSLLQFMKELIRVRLRCSLIGTANFEALDCHDATVVGLRYHDGHTLVVLNNLSDKPTIAHVSPANLLNGLTEIFADSSYEDSDTDTVSLRPYGFRWFYDGD